MPSLKRESDRVIIRPLTLKDYPAWREGHLSTGPKRSKWDSETLNRGQINKRRLESLLNRQRKFRKMDRYYNLAIFEKSSGAHIGWVSAMSLVRSVTQSAFLGYAIHNSHWRQGYAFDAIKLFFEVAFVDLKLHRLEAGIEPLNSPSIRLAKSLGFRKEGLKKRAVFLRQKWQDLEIYSITCEELGIPFRGDIRKMN
ncbi:MAG: GNAT family N-acetyltransferase [Pseudomonadota bacterium]